MIPLLQNRWRQLRRTGRKWARKGFWSVTDQALFAGANFVLNIILARWLTPTEYGAFSLAFTAFLLLGMFHTALITEPMLVFGSSRFRERWETYLNTLLVGHGGFAVVGLVVLTLAAYIVGLTGAAELRPVMLILAIAQPFILFMWLMRRACYVKLAPRSSAAGGALYAVAVVGGTYLLRNQSWLSASSALILMSAASLAAGLWIIMLLGARPVLRLKRALSAEVTKEHWQYGRWAAATGIVIWLTAKFSFLLLPIWAGLEAAAAYRALINLIMPATHAYVAISSLLIPTLVRAREAGNFSRALLTTLTLIAGAMVANWLLLGFFGQPLIGWLYAGQYVEHSGLLWLVGSLPLLSGSVAVLGAALRALERPDHVFWAYVASTIAVVTIGVALVYVYGLTGAVICQVVALTTVNIAMGLYIAGPLRAHESSESTPAPSYAPKSDMHEVPSES